MNYRLHIVYGLMGDGSASGLASQLFFTVKLSKLKISSSYARLRTVVYHDGQLVLVCFRLNWHTLGTEPRIK